MDTENTARPTVSEQIAALQNEQQDIEVRFDEVVPFAEAQQLLDRHREIDRKITAIRASQFATIAALVLADAEPHEAPGELDVRARLRQFAELIVGALFADHAQFTIQGLVDQLNDLQPPPDQPHR